MKTTILLSSFLVAVALGSSSRAVAEPALDLPEAAVELKRAVAIGKQRLKHEKPVCEEAAACAEPADLVVPAGTPVLPSASLPLKKVGYGYCYKCRYACGWKGMPMEWKCGWDCDYGWYDDCD